MSAPFKPDQGTVYLQTQNLLIHTKINPVVANTHKKRLNSITQYSKLLELNKKLNETQWYYKGMQHLWDWPNLHRKTQRAIFYN